MIPQHIILGMIYNLLTGLLCSVLNMIEQALLWIQSVSVQTILMLEEVLYYQQVTLSN